MADDYTKDPDAVLDWVFDWTPWLGASETISTSTFILTPGITKNSDTKTASTTTIWLSGGSAGKPYRITNRIVTNQGRTDDRSITIRVTDR